MKKLLCLVVIIPLHASMMSKIICIARRAVSTTKFQDLIESLKHDKHAEYAQTIAYLSKALKISKENERHTVLQWVDQVAACTLKKPELLCYTDAKRSTIDIADFCKNKLCVCKELEKALEEPQELKAAFDRVDSAYYEYFHKNS